MKKEENSVKNTCKGSFNNFLQFIKSFILLTWQIHLKVKERRNIITAEEDSNKMWAMKKEEKERIKDKERVGREREREPMY